MKRSILLLLCCIGMHAQAQTIVDEISQRSGMPASDVNALLADCKASQTAINICAWRDQIEAERKLQRAVATKGTMNVGCPQPMDAHLSAWKTQRDQACARSAKKQYGGGSMQQAAQTMCVTAAIKQMTGRINAGKCP